MVNRPLRDRHALPALAAGAHPHQAPQDEIPAGLETSVRDPIPLPRGRQLVTLRDAARYIFKLPEAEQHLGEWQAAALALILVAEHNGPTMMARIGVMRALNRNVDRTFNPSRKDTHWGRRKLKRDT